ncbi:MAG: hypothetical protein JWN33_602 [Candidatus Saccharibacteria bacterium]|nr:hypothetical protein [Candidatus Saccharibacteria bacterium]
MRSYRTRAIVLRRTNYGEADRILQLLTTDGKRSVIARGVRKEKSKLAGGIELFALSDVVLGEGRGDLGILTSARLIQFYRHILEDYDRLQFGYLVIKLITSASETLDEPEWFDILHEVLMGLDVLTIPLELVETWFYLRYAAMLGHEINLSRDITGDKLDADKTYRYDSTESGLRASERGNVTADHIKLLRLISAKPLAILAQIGGVSEVLAECLHVAREHAAV